MAKTLAENDHRFTLALEDDHHEFAVARLDKRPYVRAKHADPGMLFRWRRNVPLNKSTDRERFDARRRRQATTHEFEVAVHDNSNRCCASIATTLILRHQRRKATSIKAYLTPLVVYSPVKDMKIAIRRNIYQLRAIMEYVWLIKVLRRLDQISYLVGLNAPSYGSLDHSPLTDCNVVSRFSPLVAVG